MASFASCPPLTTTILSSALHFLTIRLTVNKYLLSKAQMVSFLKGYHLLGFVDGSLPIPLPLLEDKPNPEHTRWLQQDQLLLSTIYSSLFEKVLAQVLDLPLFLNVGPPCNLYSLLNQMHMLCRLNISLLCYRRDPSQYLTILTKRRFSCHLSVSLD